MYKVNENFQKWLIFQKIWWILMGRKSSDKQDNYLLGEILREMSIK